MNKNLPWSLKFSRHGGYDCMTSSWDIIDSTGNRVFDMDIGDLLEDENEDNKDCRETKEMAEFIINSVNGVGCDANKKDAVYTTSDEVQKDGE